MVSRPRPEPASSPEAYAELEATLYLVRDAVEAAGSFEALVDELAARNIPEDRIRKVCDLSISGDLHIHSSASDGKFPARKLAWLARLLGLRTIALTDHDSVAGCREAFREGMLVGVQVIPGLELSTDTPGLEILCYFPDAGKFFNFLTSNRSAAFREELARRQDAVHERSLAALEHVNRWLSRQGVAAENLITVAELDAWFGGQKPYFPGTLCVLGLKRLSTAQRNQLRIRDPRTFNTRVVTPFLKEYELKKEPARSPRKTQDPLTRSFAIVRAAIRAGVPAATFMAHPKELLTKGGLSLGAVRKLVSRLADEFELDGIEVACSRDTEEDVRYWMEIIREHNALVAAGGAGKRVRKTLLAASHSSDFHVLGPGLATGEITIGFGVLDGRPQFRRGNLRPQMSLEDFLDEMQRRAAENARL